jgi:CHAT domain-containing protein
LKDAARLLDPDTVLLQLHLGSNGCYLWAVGSSTAAGYALGKEQPITGLARQLHQHLTARNERPPSESAEARARRIERADVASTTTARALSELVLWPAARAIAGKKRVVIAADGALHFVPFLMLPDPNAPEEPLIAGHEVLSIPSVSVLAAVRGKNSGDPGAGKKLVLLADPVFEASDERITKAGTATVVAALEPIRGVDGRSLGRLPSSRAEAEAIAALVPGPNRRVLLDFEANRQAVLDGALADGRIIHFATHGLLDAAHPEGSGLVLSAFDPGGRPIEGTLRLVDIYGLRLNAELVTLSACETALGREIRGEGLIGLTRGFLHAGARRVIASLWKVSDRATSELMVVLYRSLMGEGSGASAALRNAVLSVRQDPKYRAPYYWAAFELQGDWAR